MREKALLQRLEQAWADFESVAAMLIRKYRPRRI